MLAKEFMESPETRTEAFGPSSIVVRARNESEMLEVASSLEGSLTCSCSENEDRSLAGKPHPNSRIEMRSLLMEWLSSGVGTRARHPSWRSLARHHRFEVYLNRPGSLPKVRSSGLQAGFPKGFHKHWFTSREAVCEEVQKNRFSP